MKEKTFDKISAFKKFLKELVENKRGDSTAVTFFFKKNFSSPKYKVTIEPVEEDFIIDSQGRKWVKANDSE